VKDRIASRRPKLAPFEAILGTGAFLAATGIRPALGPGFYRLFILAGLAVSVSASRSRAKLPPGGIELEASILRQVDSAGGGVGEIDLDAPFTYETVYQRGNLASYQLRQGSSRVEFRSDVPNAESTITEHPGAPWPPRDTFSA